MHTEATPPRQSEKPDNLNFQAQEKIASVSRMINRHPTLLCAMVEGHTQPGAPEPIATILSQKRAELVARVLTSHYGVAKERISIDWHSSRKPLDEISLGSPDPSASQNRRAEITTIISLHRREECDEEVVDIVRQKWRDRPPSNEVISACLQLAPGRKETSSSANSYR